MTGPRRRARLKQRARTERDVAVSAWIRRWPPVLWLLVSLGSLFVVEASGRTWLSVTGIVLMVLAFGVAVYLAVSRRQGTLDRRSSSGRSPRLSRFYALVALAASLSGWQYGAAAVLAALIPGTAVALLVATVRSRTRAVGDRLVDASTADSADPCRPRGSTTRRRSARRPSTPTPRATPSRQPARVGAWPARRRRCAGRAAADPPPARPGGRPSLAAAARPGRPPDGCGPSPATY